MTSRKEGEGVRQSVTLGHKGVIEGEGSKYVQICLMSFTNGPLATFLPHSWDLNTGNGAVLEYITVPPKEL